MFFTFKFCENPVKERIEKGNQLLVTYGSKKGDHELFATYGFCMPPMVNINTRVLISPKDILRACPEKIDKNSLMTPGADNLVKFFLTPNEISDDLLLIISKLARIRFDINFSIFKNNLKK